MASYNMPSNEIEGNDETDLNIPINIDLSISNPSFESVFDTITMLVIT